MKDIAAEGCCSSSAVASSTRCACAMVLLLAYVATGFTAIRYCAELYGYARRAAGGAPAAAPARARCTV